MSKLSEIRTKNKYTHKYMAEQLNISKPFYWQLENNKRKLSYARAMQIAEIFGLKPDDIFYDDFKEKKLGTSNDD